MTFAVWSINLYSITFSGWTVSDFFWEIHKYIELRTCFEIQQICIMTDLYLGIFSQIVFKINFEGNWKKIYFIFIKSLKNLSRKWILTTNCKLYKQIPTLPVQVNDIMKQPKSWQQVYQMAPPNSNSTQQCVRYQATRQQSKTVKIALFGLFLPSNASDFDKYHCNDLCHNLLEKWKKYFSRSVQNFLVGWYATEARSMGLRLSDRLLFALKKCDL